MMQYQRGLSGLKMSSYYGVKSQEEMMHSNRLGRSEVYMDG